MNRGGEKEEFDEKDIEKFINACKRRDMAKVQEFIEVDGYNLGEESVWYPRNEESSGGED